MWKYHTLYVSRRDSTRLTTTNAYTMSYFYRCETANQYLTRYLQLPLWNTLSIKTSLVSV